MIRYPLILKSYQKRTEFHNRRVNYSCYKTIFLVSEYNVKYNRRFINGYIL